MTEFYKITLPYIVLGGVALFVVDRIFKDIEGDIVPEDKKHTKEIGEACGEDLECKGAYGKFSLVGCCSGICSRKQNIGGVPVCTKEDRPDYQTIDNYKECKKHYQCKGRSRCCYLKSDQKFYCSPTNFWGFCPNQETLQRQVDIQKFKDKKPCDNKCKNDELCIDDKCVNKSDNLTHNCPKNWVYSDKFKICVDPKGKADVICGSSKCPPGWICNKNKQCEIPNNKIPLVDIEPYNDAHEFIDWERLTPATTKCGDKMCGPDEKCAMIGINKNIAVCLDK